tara:strand:+ start:5994 stop:6425 length:432 start_codon:yes stop_codon:yes gene_type:complete
MLIKKVKKRLIIILISTALLLLSITYLLKNLEKNILYFFSPTQISNDPNVIIDKEEIRVGGMVKEGSLLVQRNEIKFVITDFENEIIVTYKGTVPNLFSEGKGVIAEGKLKDRNFFIAKKIVAKHDENYMPPEIKNLKKNNVK